MNTNIKSLALLAVTLLSISACSMYNQPVETRPPGTYVSTEKSTDSNGTNYTTKKTTVVSEDSYGHKSAKVTYQTTKDPKGLFNKTKTKVTKSVTTK